MGSQYGQAKKIHVKWPVAGIIIMGAVDLLVANLLFDAFNWLPLFLKIPLAVLMLGPLAFCMGMPFPLALTGVGADVPDQIPWAWAVNGCASVIAAVLAALLAVHFGFTAVVVAALILYGFAAAVFAAGHKLKGG